MITGHVTLYGPYPTGRVPQGLRSRLKHMLFWRAFRETARWVYEENALSGRRRAIPKVGGPHQPINAHWLEGGPWDAPRPPPPAPLRRYRA